jgi:predicted small lipoprotein YifL
MRLVLLLAAVAACGSHGPHTTGDDDAMRADSSSSHDDAAVGSDGWTLADAPLDASVDSSTGPDAFPAVLDVRINCHNDCTLIASPPAINVTAGTSFQVNWINVGDTECDVTKVDQFNHVPIILGLEPGMSYHDAVRDWCGPQYTGTFDFEILICEVPSEIPVNCGA